MEVNESLTSTHFVINLINTTIGIGILAQPYAFAISGLYSIISMSMAFILVSYAGYCITKVTLRAYNLDGEFKHEPVKTHSEIDREDLKTEHVIVPTDIDTEDDTDSEDINYNDNTTPSSTVSPNMATGISPTGEKEEIYQDQIDTETKTPPNAKKNTYQKMKKAGETEQDTVKKTDTKKKSVYTEISYFALGRFGEIYGSIGMILLFSMFLVNILVMNWELLLRIIQIYAPNFNPDLVYVFVVILMVPLIFVLNWKHLTFVGWIGVVSVSVTTIIIFYLFIKSQLDFPSSKGLVPSSYVSEIDEQNVAQEAINEMIVVQLVFFSFITFVNSIAGTASIPMMVISSKNKKIKHFIVLIMISCAIVSAYYILVGVVGQQIYGRYTHVLILNNFFYWPANIVPVIISIVMIINLCGSYGMFLTIDSDILNGYFGIKMENTFKRIILRTVLWILSGIIGYVARHNLAVLIAIQGCIDSLCGPALPVPFLLYLGAFWDSMSIFSRCAHIILFLFVVGVAIVTTVGAVTALT